MRDKILPLYDSSHDRMGQSNQRIRLGFFDSGIGGLSIVHRLMEKRTLFDVFYIMDNANLPYGDKADQWIIERSQAIAEAMRTRFEIDIFVVACNTASTIALDALRTNLDIPVVGVVPAIKTASQISKARSIGLLATQATVNRPYVTNLIDEFAKDCRVIRFGSQKMVQWAEDAFLGRFDQHDALKQELVNFFSLSKSIESAEEGYGAPLDTVVLGCTHFSFLVRELEALAPWPVRWIDSAQAVASRVLFVANERQSSSRARGSKSSWKGLCTGEERIEERRARFVEMGFSSLERIEGISMSESTSPQ